MPSSTASPRTFPFFIDTNFSVIHEDEFILVIDKPAPLAVHPVGSYTDLNLHSLLKKDPRWEKTPIHFMHRLDAETSGVILIAKTPEAARFIGKEFLKSAIRKKYRAVVFGVPSEDSGEITIPLGTDSGSGFQTVRIVDFENGQSAQTRWRVIEKTDAYSLLEIEPLTGRTHQIRAHLSFIGHPVVGDKIYIDLEIFRRYVLQGLDEAMLEVIKTPRLALHASSLAFKHPGTGEDICFESRAPEFFDSFFIKEESH